MTGYSEKLSLTTLVAGDWMEWKALAPTISMETGGPKSKYVSIVFSSELHVLTQ